MTKSSDSPNDDTVGDADEPTIEELVDEFLSVAGDGEDSSVSSAASAAHGIGEPDIGDSDSDDPEGSGEAPLTSEEMLSELVGSLEEVTAQRDEYLETARRVQADFENYKRRVEAQKIEQVERAAESLVTEILPVLDACTAAIGHGAGDVAPIMSSLLSVLEKRGLDIVPGTESPFDPEVHEAVLTEPSDDDAEPVVAEVMRTGYLWHGRVVRPAMVKVRG